MKSNFWNKFDNLMDSIPDFIEEQFDKFGGESSSTSAIVQGGKKIVVKTTNNKTTITVNGKKVYGE